jgi:hypothetical protein
MYLLHFFPARKPQDLTTLAKQMLLISQLASCSVYERRILKGFPIVLILS